MHKIIFAIVKYYLISLKIESNLYSKSIFSIRSQYPTIRKKCFAPTSRRGKIVSCLYLGEVNAILFSELSAYQTHTRLKLLLQSNKKYIDLHSNLKINTDEFISCGRENGVVFIQNGRLYQIKIPLHLGIEPKAHLAITPKLFDKIG